MFSLGGHSFGAVVWNKLPGKMKGYREDGQRTSPRQIHPSPFRSAGCAYYLKGILLIKLLKIYFFSPWTWFQHEIAQAGGRPGMWQVWLLRLSAPAKQLDSSSPHESICHSSINLRQDIVVAATLTIKSAWSFLMEASDCTHLFFIT